MESHLNSIPADVRLDEVQPLNRRRLVAFFNCFIQKATTLLNDVALRNEDLLVEIEKQMRVMDIRLRILEKKVSEITLERKEAIGPNLVKQTQIEPTKDLSQGENPAENSQIEIPSNVGESPEPGYNKICEKYFKMLRMGVPETAVKLKMQSEGVDPALLTTQKGVPPPSEELPIDSADESSVDFTDSD